MKIRDRIVTTVTRLHATSGEAVEPGVVCNMVGDQGYEGRRQIRVELDQLVRDGALTMVATGPSYAYLPAGAADARGRGVVA